MKSEELVDSKIELTSQEFMLVLDLKPRLDAWDYVIREMPINSSVQGVIPNYNSHPCYVRTVKKSRL